MSTLVPSSSTAGFFQQPPRLENHFDDDRILNHIAQLYLPATAHNELAAFGQAVIQPEIFALIADAERNPPTVSTHSTFGKGRTVLHTSYGWRQLQNMGIEAGMVAIPYSKDSPSRLRQFLKYHIWTPSSAIVTCPSAMTDGAATLLRRHLADSQLDTTQRAVFTEAYRRLTSFDAKEAWTSGQWMTERSGGSDVRGTETVAHLAGLTEGKDAHGMPLGPWLVSGFKWFSSATDSQMTVLLAKTDKGGLSAFFAPMRRTAADGSVEMNGIAIQRLKPKLGTKSLPTAELVLTDVRAWLIGKEGDGVREISAILNITRVHNAISALGFWSRALAISRAYARVRKVSGKLLQDNAAHVATMAKTTVKYAAHMHLGFFVVKLLDITERPQSLRSEDKSNNFVTDEAQAKALLRLLTPVAKAQCSKQGIYGIQECMESLGGVGYIEDEQEFNIARIFRDANVLSIWEGTTDVMADDVVRVVKGRDGERTVQIFQQWVEAKPMHYTKDRQIVERALGTFLSLAKQDAAELRVRGRYLLEILAWLVAAVMLQVEVRVLGDENSKVILQAWLSQLPIEQVRTASTTAQERAVVFGAANPAARL